MARTQLAAFFNVPGKDGLAAFPTVPVPLQLPFCPLDMESHLMTETATNPTTAAHSAAEISPQALEGDILNQRAWRMPDIVIYQHGPQAEQIQ